LYKNKFQLWKIAPFLRLLIPLIVGIICQQFFNFSFLPIICLATIISFTYLLFTALPLRIKFKYLWLRGIFISLIIFSLSLLITWQKNIQNNNEWFGKYYSDSSYLVLKIEEPLTSKEKSFKTIASVQLCINQKIEKSCKGNILIYFSKNDSNSIPVYGDKILIQGGLQNIMNAGNPGGFDYAKYMAFQQTYHQIFLKKDKFINLHTNVSNPLFRFIYQAKQSVVSIIQKNINGDKKVTGIIEALLIGFKEDLDKDIVQAYSNTGVVHIIAISGMHLGLIYIVLVWLFARVPLIKRSKALQVILILTSLWLFSLITGGSASVLRSAVMFTCIVIGKTFFKETSIYNSLATSAFLLLCFDPFLLWDVGFQLSYAAVIGIVWLQKPIENIYYSKHVFIQKIWKMCAITIAAQILTLPVCIFYFHQIPTLFLFTNLICVPLSTVILFAEILLIIVSAFPPIALLVGKIIFWLTWLMNMIIEFFNKLPGSLLDKIHSTVFTTTALYLFVIFLSMSLLKKNKQLLKLSLAFLLLFTGIWSFGKMNLTHQRKMIVYNVSKHKAVDFIDNNKYSFYGDENLKLDAALQNFNLKPARVSMQAELENDSLQWKKLNNDYCHFYNKKILFIDREINIQPNQSPIKIDVLVISKNAKIKIEDIVAAVMPTVIVFDGSNSLWKITQWKKVCSALHLRFHSTPESGAFIMDAN
jgi:competence protein ComEC